MKTFEELTDAEVLTLDDEHVNQYIDYACAEAGVPLLPPRPVMPVGESPVADVQVYKVGDIYFYDQADALKASELLASLKRCSLQYVSGPRYEKVVRPDSGDVAVHPEKHFSPEHWDRVKNEANRVAEAKKTYDADIAEYNRASQLRDAIAQSITERRERVCADEFRRGRLRSNYERYLALADGNAEIAARFLQNAHTDAAILLPELFEVKPEPEPEVS